MISDTTDGKLVSDLSAENGSANDQEELKLSDLTSRQVEVPTNNIETRRIQ